jgi:uncharacterized protein
VLINLRELYGKQQQIHLNDKIDISDLVLSHPSIHDAGLVHTEADAVYEAGNVRVIGQVKVNLELECSRCLVAFNQPLAFSFTELFSNETPKDDEDFIDLDEAVNYVTEDKISLDPYIKEHVLLAMPMFPLCNDHCKGLCPSCGASLNEKACNCVQELTDPRWSGLKDFLKS